jgi:hypothetical protein
MPYIRQLPSGKFRAEIRKNQATIKNKTFINKSDADSGCNLTLVTPITISYYNNYLVIHCSFLVLLFQQ